MYKSTFPVQQEPTRCNFLLSIYFND